MNIRERGYYIWYPSQNWYFPISSKKEVTTVKTLYSQRSQEDVDQYNITDLNGTKLFHKILSPFGITQEEINNIFFNKDLRMLILVHKYLFNRARPFQIDPTITPPSYSHTYFTPAFPAGHVAQFYCVAKYYSRKFPEAKRDLMNLVDLVDQTRVKAGIHYPSDGWYSRKLVDSYF
jgi:hypothetical protein